MIEIRETDKAKQVQFCAFRLVLRSGISQFTFHYCMRYTLYILYVNTGVPATATHLEAQDRKVQYYHTVPSLI